MENIVSEGVMTAYAATGTKPIDEAKSQGFRGSLVRLLTGRGNEEKSETAGTKPAQGAGAKRLFGSKVKPVPQEVDPKAIERARSQDELIEGFNSLIHAFNSFAGGDRVISERLMKALGEDDIDSPLRDGLRKRMGAQKASLQEYMAELPDEKKEGVTFVKVLSGDEETAKQVARDVSKVACEKIAEVDPEYTMRKLDGRRSFLKAFTNGGLDGALKLPEYQEIVAKQAGLAEEMLRKFNESGIFDAIAAEVTLQAMIPAEVSKETVVEEPKKYPDYGGAGGERGIAMTPVICGCDHWYPGH